MKMKGKLRHIRIEPGKNGFAVHAHHDMPSKSDSPMSMPDQSQPSFFPDAQSTADHVKGLMQAHMGQSDNDGDEGVPKQFQKLRRR